MTRFDFLWISRYAVFMVFDQGQERTTETPPRPHGTVCRAPMMELLLFIAFSRKNRTNRANKANRENRANKKVEWRCRMWAGNDIFAFVKPFNEMEVRLWEKELCL